MKDNEVIKMDDEMYDVLQEQRRAFIKKFGREPGPSDPVFFDPECDTPTPLTEARAESLIQDAILNTPYIFSKKDN